MDLLLIGTAFLFVALWVGPTNDVQNVARVLRFP